MAQLVVSGNRILAHGEDCFLATGGTVICTETGRKFENATVVSCDCALPFDIDTVGYEYHAGAFVPCAPFGKGDGNIAVVCGNDCKSIKDSGKPMEHFKCCVELTYTGTGVGYSSNFVTVDFTPHFAIITKAGTPDYVGSGTMAASGKQALAILSRSGAHCFYIQNNAVVNKDLNVVFSENSIEWGCYIYNDRQIAIDYRAQCNEEGEQYRVLVFGN